MKEQPHTSTSGLVTFVLYQLPAMYSAQVIDWLYSAAYVWILLYIVFHILAILNRILRPDLEGTFSKGWLLASSITGILLTIFGLYFAFARTHVEYGLRAMVILIGAFVIAGLSFLQPNRNKMKAPGEAVAIQRELS